MRLFLVKFKDGQERFVTAEACYHSAPYFVFLTENGPICYESKLISSLIDTLTVIPDV